MNFNLLKIEETNNIYNIILNDPKKQNSPIKEESQRKAWGVFGGCQN